MNEEHVPWLIANKVHPYKISVVIKYFICQELASGDYPLYLGKDDFHKTGTVSVAQSAWAVEYTDCTSEEG